MASSNLILLPVMDMRANRDKPAGVPQVLRAILGTDLPVLWGWGYSDMPGHQPYLGYAHFHTGIDILIPTGTPLHAPSDGTVSVRTWRDGNKVASLRLTSGHTYRFLHLSAFAATGRVSAGDVIGYSGSPTPLPPMEVVYEGSYEVQEAQSVLTGNAPSP
ncbi:MAG: M23 family metallopeptidase [Chloroflexota bacterium]|nr:M23 family metallopeptidase [Chloroflexota bacterium]